MNVEENYVRILRESLEKKVFVLKRITVCNKEQRKIFEEGESEPDELKANLEKKGLLIDRINALDDGFEQLFVHVQDALDNDREHYREEILRMQELIREISDLSAEIAAQEQQNRTLAEQRFTQVKSNARQVRKGTAAANRYYQNMMNGGNMIRPQIMDTRE